MPLTTNHVTRLSRGLADTDTAFEVVTTLDSPLYDSNNAVFTGSGNITLSSNQKVCVVNKASGAATQVTLFAPHLSMKPPCTTRDRWNAVVIVDGKGDAATNNITIVPDGVYATTINGSSSIKISSNYGGVVLVWNGTQWNVVAETNDATLLGTANTWTALQTITLTTEQLRLGYSVGTYTSFTVDVNNYMSVTGNRTTFNHGDVRIGTGSAANTYLRIQSSHTWALANIDATDEMQVQRDGTGKFTFLSTSCFGAGTLTPATPIHGYSTTLVQGTFAGSCPDQGSADVRNGALAIGSSSSFRGLFQYDVTGTGDFYVDNSNNDAAAKTHFRMRTSGTAVTALRLVGSGSVCAGPNSALSTSATGGFLYLPTCAGTPTGVPVAQDSRVAFVYDTTNNKLYVYNGAWKATGALT